MHLRPLSIADHALRRFPGEVNWADIQAIGAQFVEPKQGHFGQQLSFAGNGLTHDHIKRTDAV